MEDSKFIVHGLSGEKLLQGDLEVEGSKNGAFPLLASSILFDGEINLENIPNIFDVTNLLKMLDECGFKFNIDKNNVCIRAPEKLENKQTIKSEEIRGSIVFVLPLLIRYKYLEFNSPGGCEIGERPINFFLDFLKDIGGAYEKEGDIYKLRMNGGIKSGSYTFPYKSVTGTVSFAITSVLLKGDTTLYNCALEPEVENTLRSLVENGAEIEGIGTETLVIKGRSGKLLPKNQKPIKNIPDRIIGITYLILGILLGSDINIKNIIPKHIEAVIDYMKDIGVDTFEVNSNNIYIKKENKDLDLSKYNAVNIIAKEFPKIPTDVQNILAVFTTQLTGKSKIKDFIYENRIRNFFKELSKMDADIRVSSDKHGAILGPTHLKGADLNSIDLRAGAAILMAALLATGESTISGISLIDRGYSRLEEKINSLGANIKRI